MGKDRPFWGRPNWGMVLHSICRWALYQLGGKGKYTLFDLYQNGVRYFI